MIYVEEKPIIGIMSTTLRPWPLFDLNKNPRFRLLVFTKKGINWREESISGLAFEDNNWKEKTLPFPNVIYNRLYTSNNKIARKFERKIGKGKVFNYITRFNKWTIYKILKQSTVAEFLPRTYFYRSNYLIDLLRNEQMLILKPCQSYLGSNVYLLKLINNSNFQLYYRTNIPRLTTTDGDEFKKYVRGLTQKNFILQQFIEFDKINDKIYDIRMLVQKNENGQWTVSGGLSRISYTNYYITNYSSKIISLESLLESKPLLKNTIEQIKSICLITAETLERKLGHLGDIGVDFGIDQEGKCGIIEVNGKTQKLLVDRTKNADLIRAAYLKPIEYANFLTKL